MIGVAPTIGDIVLTEQSPETVDLRCYEQMPGEEEEVESQSRDLYRVSASCGLCGSGVRFACLAAGEEILRLHQLLFTLQFVCVPCVKQQKLNHGG
ncbi:E7 protein [Panthera leo persica papillomavirus 1]|uniref:Protein E7 n=1 Tax=Panthera leo persica papillomavirus 1 TaxID=2772508 RepID=I6LEJ7_9PAPI|nr:E7 protein [Panthera leo persica papillomavirus 1]ALC77738.1 E7 [Panthera leo persica papillomavirus 1]ALC77742.1 E7 [Panthera leo persica papillomavirus 1]ALC77745.1 E7 [Panthera leo persica papillomavirus 1]AYE19137.1 E7 [Panthera leo persica papillomavirus 1]